METLLLQSKQELARITAPANQAL